MAITLVYVVRTPKLEKKHHLIDLTILLAPTGWPVSCLVLLITSPWVKLIMACCPSQADLAVAVHKEMFGKERKKRKIPWKIGNEI